MSALAFDLRHEGLDPAPQPQRRLFAVRGTVGELRAATLDAVLVGAWSAIASGAPASCPICAGALSPCWTAAARVGGGRCADCGSTLD